ncbi:MAG: 2-polyprenyl-3-methyl-6-methoxy-1,4-benzoquinone monooxygenase [Gammaproteobacteria bacterium]|nr:2-polyprenyl-3-methyl-6-methoxy-1,4-benzoquinone monooxygenase [Gammaproteobacteria bacterium]MDX5375019.1 2-polyprenyl-3-methyl-6-methoxy-1,4-benzoquinone monooxygenase [Gammaproteobacteria bacterium]
MRKMTLIDQFLAEIDQSLRTVHGRPPVTERPNPADGLPEKADMTDAERELAGRLMRINHAGEVSAQGLYQGQALTARREDIRGQMQRAAMEENDHLAWTEKRIGELGSHRSHLGPFWYWGSFTIGAVAGAIGDKWSLGFVTETEHQVVRHLEEHLERLPADDHKSRAILQQMKEDEAHHATVALEAGGAKLPLPVRRFLMPLMSKVMTKTSYWL